MRFRPLHLYNVENRQPFDPTNISKTGHAVFTVVLIIRLKRIVF